MKAEHGKIVGSPKTMKFFHTEVKTLPSASAKPSDGEPNVMQRAPVFVGE